MPNQTIVIYPVASGRRSIRNWALFMSIDLLHIYVVCKFIYETYGCLFHFLDLREHESFGLATLTGK